MRAGIRVAVIITMVIFMVLPMVNAATSSPTGEIHDNVDAVSNLRPNTPDLGTHDVFSDMQTDDTNYDALLEENTGGGGIDESDYVNGDAADLSDASHVGTGSPYFLDTVDATEYLDITKGGGHARWYPFGDTTETFSDGSITLYVYVIYGDGNDDLNWFIDTTGDDTGEFSGQISNPVSGWYDTGVITDFDSDTEYDAARMQLTSIASAQHLDHEIDAAYIRVTTSGGDNYELDIEVGWAGIDYTESQAQLRIYPVTGGGWPSEDIKVDIWTGTWTNVFSDLTPDQFNEVDIESYVTDASVEIRFLGGTETGDTVQDTWEIDYVEIYTWSLEYQETRTDILNIASVNSEEVQIVQTDTLNLASVCTFEVGKTLADTLNIASEIAKALSFVIEDILNIASASVFTIFMILLDTLNIASAISATVIFSKLVEDTLNLASVAVFQIGLVMTDTLNISSAISWVGNFHLTMEDTLNLASAVSLHIGMVVTDTLNISSTYGTVVLIQKLVEDTLSFASIISSGVGVTVTDTLLMASETAKALAVLMTDTLNIASVALKSPAILVTESLILGSVVAKQVKVAVTDTLQFASVSSFEVRLVVTDILQLSSSYNAEKNPGAGPTEHTVYDTFNIGSDTSVVVSYIVIDTLQISSEAHKLLSMIMTDTLNFASTMFNTVGIVVSDTLQISSNISRVLELHRTVEDILSLSSSISSPSIVDVDEPGGIPVWPTPRTTGPIDSGAPIFVEWIIPEPSFPFINGYHIILAAVALTIYKVKTNKVKDAEDLYKLMTGSLRALSKWIKDKFRAMGKFLEELYK